MDEHVERITGGMPDIRTMLAASFADEQEPLTAMLARAMIYSQDADRKLERAKAMRTEAERYREQVQRETVAQTEALCAAMLQEAEEEQKSAHDLRSEAEQQWESARAELDRATRQREEADRYREVVQAEADATKARVQAEAEQEAAALRDSIRAETEAEMAAEKERMDSEIRKAMAAMDKVQAAAQAELEAQQLYTEALRFKAASPKNEIEQEPEVAPQPKRRSRRKAA